MAHSPQSKIPQVTASAKRLLPTLYLLMVFGQGAAADTGNNIAEAAVAFVKIFVANKLTADSAKGLLGAGAQAERQGAYWQIRSAKGLEEIVFHAERVDAAELRLPLESGLVLTDLEKAFGAWQLVFSSKTSSVRFRVVDHQKKPMLVFVRLFTSRPLPNSPVLSVRVRRDDAGKEPNGA